MGCWESQHLQILGTSVKKETNNAYFKNWLEQMTMHVKKILVLQLVWNVSPEIIKIIFDNKEEK